ncbi:HERC2 [Symbiodinium natans]|uniref:HERC2 protein n=1 Tax=Symbiodinium natans TaxID=878477 RepID=A0A812KQ13_9DINO|nr:HERC2 [Symbiodinium natans]
MESRYRAARIFIAGCATQSSLERQLAVPRRSRDQRGTHNLEGTIADVSTMLRLFEDWDKADGKTQVQYMHIYQIPGKFLPKQEVMSRIEKAMDTAQDEVLLWYSGHGQTHTGNWTFQEENEDRCSYVSFEEIATLWLRRPRTATLHVFMDSCFAGAWAEEACRLGPDKKIAVFAACQADEEAGESREGGNFTRRIRDVVQTGQKSEEKIYMAPLEEGTLFSSKFRGQVLNRKQRVDQHPCAYFPLWDERRVVTAERAWEPSPLRWSPDALLTKWCARLMPRAMSTISSQEEAETASNAPTDDVTTGGGYRARFVNGPGVCMRCFEFLLSP